MHHRGFKILYSTQWLIWFHETCFLSPLPALLCFNASVLHPSVQDHDFFQHLEMHMRSEFPPLCGRDHLSFRSYYFPVKVGICWNYFTRLLISVRCAHHHHRQLAFIQSLVCLLCFSLQNVIDGDLCEQFNSMDPHKQKSVAEELDRTPPEVSKKLEDIRTRYAF